MRDRDTDVIERLLQMLCFCLLWGATYSALISWMGVSF